VIPPILVGLCSAARLALLHQSHDRHRRAPEAAIVLRNLPVYRSRFKGRHGRSRHLKTSPTQPSKRPGKDFSSRLTHRPLPLRHRPPGNLLPPAPLQSQPRPAQRGMFTPRRQHRSFHRCNLFHEILRLKRQECPVVPPRRDHQEFRRPVQRLHRRQHPPSLPGRIVWTRYQTLTSSPPEVDTMPRRRSRPRAYRGMRQSASARP
jgi:hypothetical protein